MQQRKTPTITVNMLFLKGGYFEDLKYQFFFSYFTNLFLLSCMFLVLLMLLVRICNVNSLEKKRKDIKYIDCVRTFESKKTSSPGS